MYKNPQINNESAFLRLMIANIISIFCWLLVFERLTLKLRQFIKVWQLTVIIVIKVSEMKYLIYVNQAVFFHT